MAERTEIAWADSTLNPWIGCQNVSPGCDHCYAESWSDRFHFTEWGPHGARRRTSPAKWREPRKWNADAEAFEREHGRRRRVFCASFADWLDNQAPQAWRADLLALIDATPELDWLLLTKRPENAGKFVPAAWWGRPNVWFGITAEDQAHFERRWPIAAKIPATIHFVSYEPALGPLDIRRCGAPYPDWIIYGGESGSGARPAETEWASDVIEQSREVGSAVFVKQLGRNARAASRPLPSRDRATGGDRKNGRQSCACGNFLLSLDDSLLRCASAELDRSPSRQADRQRQRRHRERDKWG
jgi:protein gp37